MWKDPVFLTVLICSSLLFGGICFGFLHIYTELPSWVCWLLALPLGVLTFLLIIWLFVFSETPAS